jgi:signal transduction histidine kinase
VISSPVASPGPGADSTPPSEPLARFANRLSKIELRPGVATGLALLLVAVASYGDATTRIATTFTLFYVVALLLAVWYAGLRVAYLVALAAIVGNAYSNAVGSPPATGWFLIWNACLDLALYVICAHLLSALQRRLRAERLAKQDALGQLRHAERLTTLGRLASGIAHEIGTPLNVISGRAELIASGALSMEAVAVSSRIIIEQTERVSSIIRQLLDFARRGGTRLEATELKALLEQTCSLLGPLASKSQVEISCSGQDMAAKINRSELQQVVTNLLTNAIHAMPGGGKVEVRLARQIVRDPRASWVQPRPHAVISVQDHGGGISPEILPRIFEPFFTTRDVGVGTGLGLSVAYGIMQDHGGWIEVDTELGQGTTVSLFLPQ